MQLEEEVLRLLATAQRLSMTPAEVAMSDRLVASVLASPARVGEGGTLADHQCALRYTLDCVVLSLERDAGGENDAEAVQELSQVRLARWYQVT